MMFFRTGYRSRGPPGRARNVHTGRSRTADSDPVRRDGNERQPLITEQHFLVGFQDVGSGFRMTDAALLEAMSDTGYDQCAMMGHGVDSGREDHLAWFVLNWRLRVIRRPVLREIITVRTWSTGASGLRFSRDFEVYDASGSLIAAATSCWLAMNHRTSAILRLSEEDLKVYEPDTAHRVFPGYTFSRRLREDFDFTHETAVTVNPLMTDMYRHVHNTVYLSLAAMALPEGTDMNRFTDVEVLYKHQIRPDETIRLRYAEEDGSHYVLISDCADGTGHALIRMWC